MENLHILILGVVAILGIVGVFSLVDKFNSLMAKTFITRQECTDCRGKCSNAVNLKLEAIGKTQIKHSLVLSMIANKLGLDGIRETNLGDD